MRTAASVLALLLCLFATLAPAPAQDAVDLGVIKPRALYTKSSIMVAPFNVEDNVGVNIETLPRVIRRDLELTGLFKFPADTVEANRQNLRDGRGGTVDFAAWEAMGVEQYLMGRVAREGGNMRVRVLLYDIATRSLIFERFFTDTAAEERRLAHRISDEVVLYVKGMQGFAQTKMLFVNEQVRGVKEIAIVDSDGFNPRALTRFGSICSSPEWGARGTEFYYGSYAGNRARLMGQQLTSGSQWVIAAYGGTNHSPAWSEAAGRLLMVLSKDGNSEIYTANREGGGLRRLSTSKATEGSAVWSPDGSRIAFASDEAGGVQIFLMGADGSGRQRLTPKGSWNDAPSWSPDGKRIAFVSRSGGRSDIYVYDFEAAEPQRFRRLTQNQGDNASPSWAPGGRHIAFASNRSGQWQVYLMLDDGTNQQQITTIGQNRQPDWGPAPPPLE
ncbi:MAG: hypothetical protein SF028_03390 [Candidatus Sumerlaeia bacterium]|nr:hypothetical protein [Candidatus Sumerlaeia bacterium]